MAFRGWGKQRETSKRLLQRNRRVQMTIISFLIIFLGVESTVLGDSTGQQRIEGTV